MSDVINHEAALDAAEKSLDVIEDQLDNIEAAAVVVRNNSVLIAGAAVVGLGLGAAGGYFFAKKKLAAAYEEQIATDLREAKEHWTRMTKTNEDGSVLTPMQVLAEAHGRGALDEALSTRAEYAGEAVLDDAGMDLQESALAAKAEARLQSGAVEVSEAVEEKMAEPIKEVTKTVTKTIFTEPKGSPLVDLDMDIEGVLRSRETPYVITHDEYFENETDFVQSSLSYFDGDGVVADDKSQPIRDHEAMIGEDTLEKFGVGSKDGNIVYVRNENLEVDFEIVRSFGKYTVEALGFDEPDTLSHSDRRRRRSRSVDDD